MQKEINTQEQLDKFFQALTHPSINKIDDISKKSTDRNTLLIIGACAIMLGQLQGATRERFLNNNQLTKQDVTGIVYSIQHSNSFEGMEISDVRNLRTFVANMAQFAEDSFDLAVSHDPLPPTTRRPSPERTMRL